MNKKHVEQMLNQICQELSKLIPGTKVKSFSYDADMSGKARIYTTLRNTEDASIEFSTSIEF